MIFRQTESILLASRSPRRQQLLHQLGVKFELLDVEIDESVNLLEKPLDYVERMAADKALAAKANFGSNLADKLILAADTSVVYEQTILGKPVDLEQAKQMLQMLSGKTHQVYTSVAIISKAQPMLKTSITQVEFAPLSLQSIEEYCDDGEGLDKAGGYAIQGIAAQFVSNINGSYSGVVGLPLYETSLLLKAHFKQPQRQ